MADYKESPVSGTAWTRCYEIAISNPAQGQPTIQFREQQVATLDDKVVPLAFGLIEVPFDPTAVIDIYDPATLQKTGATVTHADIYGLLFSAYLTAAIARDNAVPVIPGPPA